MHSDEFRVSLTEAELYSHRIMSQAKDKGKTTTTTADRTDEPPTDSAALPDEDAKASDSAPSEGMEPSAPAELDEQEPDERLQALERQLKDERDQTLRCHAEMENLRKRTDRELSNARQYALEPFAALLLEVRDNLERSLSDHKGQSLEAMRTGVELTLKILSETFTRFNIEEVAPKIGEPFNPQWHEALSTLKTAEHPPKAVVELVQKGYRLHQRLLRPALVVVSAAPEKAAETTDQKKA